MLSALKSAQCLSMRDTNDAANYKEVSPAGLMKCQHYRRTLRKEPLSSCYRERCSLKHRRPRRVNMAKRGHHGGNRIADLLVEPNIYVSFWGQASHMIRLHAGCSNMTSCQSGKHKVSRPNRNANIETGMIRFPT